MLNMGKLPNMMIGQEATDFFNSFRPRSPIQDHLGFKVFEKRDMPDNSMISRAVGYYAYYAPYAAKKRPAIFVQARTLSDLKTKIETARTQVGF